MATKLPNIKSKRQKTAEERRLATKVAELCSCNRRYVQYIIDDQRKVKSPLSENVWLVYNLLKEGYKEVDNKVSEILQRA